MSIVLYFVMLKLFLLEMNEIPNGKAMVREQLKKLGPLTGAEWRLLVITLSLLVLWSTENVLHPFDSASVTLVAVAAMLMPHIGVFSWKQAEKNIDRKSTRLNSSHVKISYAVFCLKKKSTLQ